MVQQTPFFLGESSSTFGHLSGLATWFLKRRGDNFRQLERKAWNGRSTVEFVMWACPQKRIITHQIGCSLCGAKAHFERISNIHVHQSWLPSETVGFQLSHHGSRWNRHLFVHKLMQPRPCRKAAKRFAGCHAVCQSFRDSCARAAEIWVSSRWLIG